MAILATFRGENGQVHLLNIRPCGAVLRPCGALTCAVSRVPGLAPWAIIFRPYGAGLWACGPACAPAGSSHISLERWAVHVYGLLSDEAVGLVIELHDNRRDAAVHDIEAALVGFTRAV